MGANLIGANFGNASGINGNDIKIARNWVFAHYEKMLLEEMKLPADHTENLRNKVFRYYDLRIQTLEKETLRLYPSEFLEWEY